MLTCGRSPAWLAVSAGTAIAVVARAVPGLFRRPLPRFRGIALRVGLAGMVDRDRQLHADDPLDGAQLGVFGRIAQRDRDAVGAVAAGAADAVDVALRLVRQVEVHDMADAGHVDAARGDVGRHQDAHRTVAEPVQRLLAGVLRLVAVDHGGVEAVALEVAHDAVGAMLGAREHDHRAHRLVGEHRRQHLALLLGARHARRPA